MGSISAQDADFSQHYATPLNLNPALCGSYNGTYRVGGIYRDAWRSFSAVPLSSYVFNGEYRFKMSEGMKYSDYGGGGIRFFSDQTPTIDQNTNAIHATFAYHKAMSQFDAHYLSIGFEAGLVQKNINYENLTFADQYNNIDEFVGYTKEDLQPNNFGFADFSTGISYSGTLNDLNSIQVGISLKHLTTPNISFWRKNLSKDSKLVKVNRLPLLIGFQTSSEHKLRFNLSLLPRIILQYQGANHIQAFTGSTVRMGIGLEGKSAVHVGGFVRMIKHKEQYGIAHVTPFVGFEYHDLLIGFSYDLHLGTLGYRPKHKGIFEFSVRYTGEVEENSAFCPEF